VPPRPPARASGGAATLLPAATTPLSTATPSGGAELKELKLSYKIGDHDFAVRERSAIKFLGQGNKVGPRRVRPPPAPRSASAVS
jgi:hypothetical protein